jgi:hypothetical protein
MKGKAPKVCPLMLRPHEIHKHSFAFAAKFFGEHGFAFDKHSPRFQPAKNEFSSFIHR